MAKKEVVAVVGAGGSTGKLMVDACLERGYRVVAIDQPGVSLGAKRRNVSVHSGALTSRSFLRKALSKALYLVHCLTDDSRSLDHQPILSIHHEAVRTLYQVAAEVGIRQFVYLSTYEVYELADGYVTEQMSARPRSEFARAKLEAESQLVRLAGSKGSSDRGPAVTILRLALTYGPADRTLGGVIATYTPLVKLLLSYVPALKGGARLSWIHKEDVARAAVFVLGREESFGETYNVADDEPMSFGESVNASIESLNQPLGPQLSFPQALIERFEYILRTDLFGSLFRFAVTRLWSWVRQRYGITDDLFPRYDRAALDYTLRDAIIDNRKLKKLGFELLYPNLRIGFPQAIRWYQEKNWLPEFTGTEEEEVDHTGGLSAQFRETMKGEVVEMSGVRSPMKLILQVRATKITTFLRTWTADLSGTLLIDGFADRVPIEGTLEIALVSRRELLYDFGFTANDGKAYRLIGHKTIDTSDLLTTFTTFNATILDERGSDFATAVLFFDLKHDLIPFLLSFRFLRTLPQQP